MPCALPEPVKKKAAECCLRLNHVLLWRWREIAPAWYIARPGLCCVGHLLLSYCHSRRLTYTLR